MNNDDQLDQTIFDKIKQILDENEPLMDFESYDSAIKYYDEAYNLLPEPREKWAASLYILSGKGEAFFKKGDFIKGEKIFRKCLFLPKGFKNPFIHLRHGQCLYEIGEKEKAVQKLTMAYIAEGKPIFSEDDSKYFDFVIGHFKNTEHNRIFKDYGNPQEVEWLEDDKLDDASYNKIIDLLEEMDSILDFIENYSINAKEYDKIIQLCNKAYGLLPKPQEKWIDIGAAILGRKGDAIFWSGNFKESKKFFQDFLYSPAALDDPFVHLRYGQSLYEVGNKEDALEELTIAYVAEGDKIFSKEKPKYLDFVKQHLK